MSSENKKKFTKFVNMQIRQLANQFVRCVPDAKWHGVI